MGSPLWAPRGAGGSLWGWAASRLRLDWTTRLFQEEEEMLVLTQSDELNRVYCENNGVPSDQPCPGDGPSTKETPSPGESPSSSSSWRDRATLKETTATLVSSRNKSVTITSAVSSGSYDKRRTSHEEEPAFHQKRFAGRKQTFSGGGGEETEEGSARSGGSVEEEKAGVALDAAARRHCSAASRLSPQTTITAWEAGWNVTNAIQGIFVLGLPFALVQSGFVGLLLLVASAWICNHTGRTLVACLYEEQRSAGLVSRVRVRRSYQDVMEACCEGLWPKWAGVGGWMVNVAQVIELLMTCTLYLLVSTSLLSDSLSGAAVPRSACSLASLMFVLPCLLLTDLRPVSTLSLLCSLAHILISLLVMLYCLSRASSWSWSVLSLTADPEDFTVSAGVIIFSYTSQIFLPPLEGSMEDRGRFDAMLGWTHGAACVMKTMFSLLAVLTWGPETREVITDNLPSDLRPLVNLCLLAKALLSYPLPFYAAAEILQTCVLRDAAVPSGHGGVSRASLAVRGALLAASYLLALMVPRFSLLMGLTGSVTGAAMTLILPCLFHLRLQWGRLAARERLVDGAILVLGVVCSVSGVVCSVKRLLEGL